MDIEILGTFHVQSFNPVRREVARLFMQICHGSGVEGALRRGAGKATAIWWEKGLC